MLTANTPAMPIIGIALTGIYLAIVYGAASTRAKDTPIGFIRLDMKFFFANRTDLIKIIRSFKGMLFKWIKAFHRME